MRNVISRSVIRRRLGFKERFAIIRSGPPRNPLIGEMSEWLKEHAWKAILATLTK
jgi:hypothetical protein